MNKAKAAVDSFLSKDGKHDTTVHEVINPAVEHESVTRSERDETQTAIDREVHQDHYHTSVQPVQAREVLPEQHVDTIADVENRSYQHGNAEHVKQRLAAERAQFKNTKNVSDIQHTEAIDPTIAGEHVHHHVHETIQPVVQKETVQPSVVHTTLPIHELHQNEPKHHTATQLPSVTLDEFRRQGGQLGGREEHTDAFEGEPKSVGGTLGGSRAAGTTSLTEGDYGTGTYGSSTLGAGTTGVGTTGVGTGTTAAGTSGAGTGTTATGTSGTTGTAATGNTGAYGPSGSGTRYSTERTRGSTSSGGKRQGLIDKLNPMKGSDVEARTGITH